MSNQTATLGIPVLEQEAIGPALSPRQLIWRRFRKHHMALFGIFGFTAMLLFIVIGSIFVTEEKANVVDLQARLSSPSADHWMGTDSTGRDIFARIIHGGQISLLVGILAVTISVSAGTIIGAAAAYYGGGGGGALIRFPEATASLSSPL